MGQIIPFPIERTGRPNAIAADQSCEVLIFTGIRIDRHDEAELALARAAPVPTRTGT